jgi:hypothetical protein
MGKAKSATVSSELGLKVESGVDLLSGSSARSCVVWWVYVYFLFSGVGLVRLPTVIELKIATYGWQEA